MIRHDDHSHLLFSITKYAARRRLGCVHAEQSRKTNENNNETDDIASFVEYYLCPKIKIAQG
jgi:hypothetical protein